MKVPPDPMSITPIRTNRVTASLTAETGPRADSGLPPRRGGVGRLCEFNKRSQGSRGSASYDMDGLLDDALGIFDESSPEISSKVEKRTANHGKEVSGSGGVGRSVAHDCGGSTMGTIASACSFDHFYNIETGAENENNTTNRKDQGQNQRSQHQYPIKIEGLLPTPHNQQFTPQNLDSRLNVNPRAPFSDLTGSFDKSSNTHYPINTFHTIRRISRAHPVKKLDKTLPRPQIQLQAHSRLETECELKRHTQDSLDSHDPTQDPYQNPYQSERAQDHNQHQTPELNQLRNHSLKSQRVPTALPTVDTSNVHDLIHGIEEKHGVLQPCPPGLVDVQASMHANLNLNLSSNIIAGDNKEEDDLRYDTIDKYFDDIVHRTNGYHTTGSLGRNQICHGSHAPIIIPSHDVQSATVTGTCLSASAAPTTLTTLTGDIIGVGQVALDQIRDKTVDQVDQVDQVVGTEKPQGPAGRQLPMTDIKAVDTRAIVRTIDSVSIVPAGSIHDLSVALGSNRDQNLRSQGPKPTPQRTHQIVYKSATRVHLNPNVSMSQLDLGPQDRVLPRPFAWAFLAFILVVIAVLFPFVLIISMLAWALRPLSWASERLGVADLGRMCCWSEARDWPCRLVGLWGTSGRLVASTVESHQTTTQMMTAAKLETKTYQMSRDGMTTDAPPDIKQSSWVDDSRASVLAIKMDEPDAYNYGSVSS